MLLGQEQRRTSDGLVVTRSYHNFDHVWKANHELKKEIGDGFTEKREMRHILRLPAELEDVDPIVKYAMQGDKTCQRLMVAKYAATKVCTGNI